MPELPETETIARDLDREVAGLVIRGAVVRRADVLRAVTAPELARRVAGARIERGWRRAKCIVLDLDTRDRLVVQPRFTGALLLDDGALAESERRYATLTFALSDGRALHYRDIRRLGTVALLAPGPFARYTDALGAEPLEPGFSPAVLAALLAASRRPLKAVLMDQRRLVGVGNIYAQEACWRAALDPSRPADAVAGPDVERLHAALTGVLRESIAARGTSFRDYRDAAGDRGGFAERLDVYARGGQPCHRCGTRLVSTHAIDGRSTVFCWRCQG